MSLQFHLTEVYNGKDLNMLNLEIPAECVLKPLKPLWVQLLLVGFCWLFVGLFCFLVGFVCFVFVFFLPGGRCPLTLQSRRGTTYWLLWVA